MARPVRLSDEAYNVLAIVKREGESYSDALLRIAAERRDPRQLLDLSPPREEFDLEELRAQGRAGDQAKLEEMFGREGGG